MTGSADDTQASKGTTSGISGGETTIRAVIFSGKKDDWESWKEKFTVRAAIKGYDHLLYEADDIDIPATYKEDGKTKCTLTEDQKELVELNKKAFGDLIISIDCTTAAGKVAFSMIKNTKTKEYPTGDITIAWLRLKKKYEPSTAPQLMRLTREFYHKFLKPDQDPDVFITEMEALQIQMQDLGHHMPDKNLIMQVLNNLTRDYEMDVNMLEYRMEQLKIENKELTIEDVRTTLNLRYVRLKTSHKVPHKSVEHAYYMGGKFKGKCHWCGKIGHKSSECKLRISGKPKNNDNQETRNYGKNPNGNSGTANKVDRKNLYCTYCKNKGHDVNECRKKKREESGYNPSTVKEVACMAMERTTSTNPLPSVGTCIGCMCTLGSCFRVLYCMWRGYWYDLLSGRKPKQ